MDEFKDISVLRYLKDPAPNIQALYVRYPDGGEYGWFAILPEKGSIVYWDNSAKKWATFISGSIILDYDDLINRPVLDTTSVTELQPTEKEVIDGIISLHKICKTGNFNDLIDKPDIQAILLELDSLGGRLTEAEESLSNSQAAINKIPLYYERRWCFIYNVSEAVCIDFTMSTVSIPANVGIHIPGVTTFRNAGLVEIDVSAISTTFYIIVYNVSTKLFSAKTAVPGDNEYIVATVYQTTVYIQSALFSVNGNVIRNTVENSVYIKSGEASKRGVSILRSTPANCLNVDYNELTVTIPGGCPVFVDGLGFKISIRQTLPLQKGSVYSLFYDYANNTFLLQSVTGASYLSDSIFFVAYISDQKTALETGEIIGLNSEYYSINGIIYSTKKNDIAISNKISNFFDINFIVENDSQARVIKALKSIKVYTTTGKYTYRIIAAKNNRTTVDMFIIYTYNRQGTKVGEIRLGTNNITFITDTLWYAVVNLNSDTIYILFEHAEITSDFLDLNSPLYISENNYIYGGYNRGKLYCNLGASTSGMAWHPNAVAKNGLSYKSYSCGGARWKTVIGQLNYDPKPSGYDNCMMNQVCRLFKDFDDNGYYPDVITFLCGLNDSYTGEISQLGTLEDAINADLTGLTAENWFSTASESYKNNAAINIRAILEFISKKLPFAQLIILTTQATHTPAGNLLYANVEKTNDLLISIAKRLSIPVIDFFHECGINDITDTQSVFTADMVHPNNDGLTLMSNYYAMKLKSMLFLRR